MKILRCQIDMVLVSFLLYMADKRQTLRFEVFEIRIYCESMAG